MSNNVELTIRRLTANIRNGEYKQTTISIHMADALVPDDDGFQNSYAHIIATCTAYLITPTRVAILDEFGNYLMTWSSFCGEDNCTHCSRGWAKDIVWDMLLCYRFRVERSLIESWQEPKYIRLDHDTVLTFDGA